MASCGSPRGATHGISSTRTATWRSSCSAGHGDRRRRSTGTKASTAGPGSSAGGSRSRATARPRGLPCCSSRSLVPLVTPGRGTSTGPPTSTPWSSRTLAEDAVSLHVYCRPYDECDIYDTEQGAVRRVRLVGNSVPPHLAAVGRGPAPRARGGVTRPHHARRGHAEPASSWSTTSPIPSPGRARCWSRRSPAASAARTCTREARRASGRGARARRRSPFVMDLARDVVMGHEFCAEIVDYGPGRRGALPPARACARMPVAPARRRARRRSATRTTGPAATASTCASRRRCCSRCRTASRPSTPR